MNLAIDVNQVEDNAKVSLAGEIDIYTADKLKEKLLPLVESINGTVHVDLESVSYMDSTGLGVFIQAYKTAMANKSDLEIIHVQERVLRLFTITGLDEILNIKKVNEGGE